MELVGDVVINNIPSFFTELLNGVVDGINTTFTTTWDFLGNTSMVYLNGLKLVKDLDYSEIAPNTIEMNYAPLNTDFTDNLEIIYIRV